MSATTAQLFQNPGARIWMTVNDVISSAANGIAKIKDSPSVSTDLLKILTGDLFKGGYIPITNKAAGAFKSWTALIDATQTISETNFFASGAWRKATIYTIAQEFFFLGSEVLGLATWGAELGFYTLGTGFLAYANAAIGFTAGAGFLFLGINSGVMWWNSENQQQSTYYFMMTARSALAAGGFGLFGYSSLAVAAGLAASPALVPISAAAIIASMSVSVLAHFYKMGYGNEKTINDLAEKPVFDAHKPDVNRNPGPANFLTKCIEAADAFADSTDLQEKFFSKFVKPCWEALTSAFKWIHENGYAGQWASDIANSPGMDALMKVFVDYGKVYGGFNFLSRLGEWLKRDENGDLEWQKAWSSNQILNRIFLTGGHFVEFLKFLTWSEMINISIMSAEVVFMGLTFNLNMIKEVLIIASSVFGIRKATEETENAGDNIAKAHAKMTSKLALLADTYKNNNELRSDRFKEYVQKKYSDTVVREERRTGIKLNADLTPKVDAKGKNRPITEAQLRKHELLNSLSKNETDTVQKQTELLTETVRKNSEQIQNRKGKLEEIEKSIFRGFFRWKEIRVLKNEIKTYEQENKIATWFNKHISTGALVEGDVYPEKDIKSPLAANIIHMQPGMIITLPPADIINADPIEVKPNEGVKLPAGTKIKLPHGAETTLFADSIFTLKPGKPGITLQRGAASAPIDNESALQVQSKADTADNALASAFAFKSLSKLHKWDHIITIHNNLLPKIEEKSFITKWYERGKIVCCIVGFGIAATGVTLATTPWLWVFCLFPFAPTGFMGAWKGYFDFTFNKLKREDKNYKVPLSTLYV